MEIEIVENLSNWIVIPPGDDESCITCELRDMDTDNYVGKLKIYISSHEAEELMECLKKVI